MPVIHDLYSPTFLAEAPIVDAEPASPARADAASDGDWTYNPQRHGAFEAFFRHADFPPFRARVERNIDDLIAFARAGDLRGAVPHLEALRNKLFDIGLDGHPLSVKPYEVIKSYGPLVESLDRLVPLFHDETMRLESRRTELQRLAPELPVCANGALNAVQSALIQLELKRSGLGGKFRATVEHIVEQAATDAVEIKYQRDFHLAHLEQRHYVAGLKSKLYQELGLRWELPADDSAYRRHSENFVRRVAGSLTEAIAPGAVARVMAEDYLARFTDSMNETLRPRGAGAWPTDGDVEDCTALLSLEFGPPPPRHGLLRQHPDGIGWECLSDPTLVAAHLLDSLHDAGMLQQRRAPSTVARWTTVDLPPARCELQSVDGLTWVEENGHRRALEAEDLKQLNDRATLSAPMVLAAIANSPPDTVATLAAPDWLLDREVGDRLLGRVGLGGVAALVEARRAAGTWTDELDAWWTGVQEAHGPNPPPTGRISWSDAQGQHQLAPVQISDLLGARIGDLLDQREPGPLSTETLSHLSDLLSLTLTEPAPRAPRAVDASDLTNAARAAREARNAFKRAMAIEEPIRTWWATVGEALRADPPRMTGTALADVLTTAGSASTVPFVRALTVADDNVRQVFMEGLTELQRDGLLATDRLVARLTQPHAASDGLMARLTSPEFDLETLLAFTTRAVADGHLERERGLELFFGSAPIASSSTPLPLVLFERAAARADKRLRAYFSALREAASRGVVTRDELLRLTGHGRSTHPVADAWQATPSMTKRPPASAWFLGIAQLCAQGHLSVEEAETLLVPPPAGNASAWGDLADNQQQQQVLNILWSVPRPSFAGLREPLPPEPTEVTQRRRQLLSAVTGAGSGTPCRLIRALHDAVPDPDAGLRSFIEQQLALTMKTLGFGAEEIAAAVGNPVDAVA